MESIKDIARKAKVSIGTVDRVLHDRGRVSETTRARVQGIITQAGYRPNIYARNLSLAKTFEFGVIMPRLSQDSGYWQIPANGIERAHEQFGIANVHVRYFYFDRYSNASFEQAFRKASRARLDGSLIAPVLPEIARRLVATIPLNTPYVFFDSTVPGTEPLTSIGQDPFQSGVLAANLMARVNRAGGTVALVKVIPDDYHINERLRGFKCAITSMASIRAVEYRVDSHGGEAAFRSIANRILRDNADLLGIFVSNAWTHPFAHMVGEQRATRTICIIGYDLVAENRKCLEEGSIDFIISQRPVMQGFEGINALYRNVVLRDNVKNTILVPLDIITKENVHFHQD